MNDPSRETRRETRIVLIGLIGLFCAIGLMILVVTVFGGGWAGE